MGERMMDLGQGLEIWKVHIDELREQDLNARSMPRLMFERLAQTVKKDQRLESLPLIAQRDGLLEIVSGHHRVRAARTAGLTEIFAIVDTTGLSKDHVKAKQLAHNSIQGSDNAQLVQKIWDSIGEVNVRMEAFIDPQSLGHKLERVNIGNLDLGIEYRTVAINFLPYEAGRWQQALEKFTQDLPDQPAYSAVYLAELEKFEQFRQAVRRVGQEYDIRAIGTTLDRMCAIAMEYVGAPLDSTEDLVPLRDVFGTSLIPADLAAELKKRVGRMISDGTITKDQKWRILALLLEDAI